MKLGGVSSPLERTPARNRGSNLHRDSDDFEQSSDLSPGRQKQVYDKWVRNVAIMNEQDDKADVREGIAETKGLKRKINEDYRAMLRLVPREQNTKVFKMLK